MYKVSNVFYWDFDAVCKGQDSDPKHSARATMEGLDLF